MLPTKGLTPLSRSALMALVVRLHEQVAQLTGASEELRREIAELKRAGKRQAAPFSNGTLTLTKVRRTSRR